LKIGALVKLRGARRTYEVEDWRESEREREEEEPLRLCLHSMSEHQEFVPVVGDGD
jgi:hypothetical protein